MHFAFDTSAHKMLNYKLIQFHILLDMDNFLS
jgi:hypothetical protein